MELGEPRKVYTIEPIEDPVPHDRPGESEDAPHERTPEPSRTTTEPARLRGRSATGVVRSL
jgi:hypothetical protein